MQYFLAILTILTTDGIEEETTPSNGDEDASERGEDQNNAGRNGREVNRSKNCAVVHGR